MKRVFTQFEGVKSGIVRATIGRESFVGEVVDRGHDGQPVIYVEDSAGRTHAVRPDLPTHELHNLEGEA